MLETGKCQDFAAVQAIFSQHQKKIMEIRGKITEKERKIQALKNSGPSVARSMSVVVPQGVKPGETIPHIILRFALPAGVTYLCVYKPFLA